MNSLAAFVRFIDRLNDLIGRGVSEGKYASLSFWRDREAVAAWRCHAAHEQAQRRGKQEIFARYRIRVAEVERDYGSPGEHGPG